MNGLQAIRALGPVDVKQIRRDSLLRWVVIMPLVAALATRWVLSQLLVQVSDIIQFDLLPYYPPIMAYFMVVMTPALVGMVVGFLLLDQRDDRTLIALQTTPLTATGYLVYRLAAPMALSLILSVISLPLSGIAKLGTGELLVTAVAAAPLAPIFALILGAFAANKVQGFALSKASGVLFLPPVVAYFAPGVWQALLALAPTYWPARLLWALEAGETGWPWLAAGLGYQTLLLWLLLRRFRRTIQ